MRYKLKPNKLLPVLLAVIMVLTMMPATAFAVGEPPTLQTAEVMPDGRHVELTFDKEMATPDSGSAGFAVTGYGGANKKVTAAALDGGNTKKILLTLDYPITGGEAPWLSYTPGTVKSTDEGVLAQINSFDITNALPHPVFTTTTPLPEGMVGAPYTHTFTATGGTLPYSFNREFGSLPAGLSLDSAGVLSGTPSNPVNSSFDIRVRDVTQAFERKNFTLKINPAAASAPTITGAVMDAKNNYITVTFSEGIYGDSAHSTGITKEDFEIVFAQNGGKVSGASIRWVDQVGVAISPAGGETQVEIKLNLIDGPPSGTETITISPKANSIYNASGEAVSATGNSKVLTLNSLAAQSFAEGYPKLGAAQAAGSKKVEVLAKAIQNGTLYYSVLLNNAPSPTAQQVKDHSDIDGHPVVSWGAQGISSTIDSIISASGGTINHNTDYDLYMVAEAGNNNFSEVKKLDIKTPPDITGDTVIDIAAIGGVPAPATGGVPVTTVTDTAQYTGTVSWSPAVSSNFAAATTYTATITLTPKSGYTLTGVVKNFFTVSGATTVSNSAGSGVITAVFPETAPAPGGSTGNPVWTKKAVLPTSSPIEDMKYLNSTYWAVGYNSTLLKSSDGTNWTKVNVGSDFDRLGGIAYGNSTYVLVGSSGDYSGRIYTSSDGSTWTERTAVPQLLSDVAFGQGKFVAVGGENNVLISTDNGATWQSKALTHPPGKKTNLLSIAHSDFSNKFVAVGMGSDTGQHEGGIMTSADGKSWVSTYSDANKTIWDVTYGDGGFVAVGGNNSSGITAISMFGDSWTPNSSPSAELYSINYDGNSFIAAGRTNPGATAFTTVSSNGVIWTGATHGGIPGFSAAVSNGTTHTAADSYGSIHSKPVSDTLWDLCSMGSTRTLNDVAYNGSDLYVAVGEAGVIQTSSDGQTWTIQTSGTTENLNQVAYFNGQFIAVGNKGTIRVSTDGITWASRTSGTTLALKGIAYGDGKYVVVGGNDDWTPVMLVSTDNAATWSSLSHSSFGINVPLRAVAFGSDTFVTLTKNGAAFCSTNGGTLWASAGDLGSGAYPADLIYAGDKFAAASSSGRIYLSSDKGANWTLAKDELNRSNRGLAYADGNLIAVGELGNIIASADGGTTWYIQPSGLELNPHSSDNSMYSDLHGITAGNNCFLAVGAGGLVLQSDTSAVSANSDDHDVAVAKAALGINKIMHGDDNAGRITRSMNLVTQLSASDLPFVNVNSGALDVGISWQSSKPQYIASNGTVTRPAFADGDQIVYLTATFTEGAAVDTKQFIVRVPAYENSDTQDVQTAWNALSFDTIKAGNTATDDITSNLDLSYVPANGVTISWASNDPAITTGGAVTRPAQGSGDRYVTLTATLTKGSVTQTKTFDLTVKAIGNQDALDVAAAIAALDFNTIKGSNVEEESVTANLNLITSGIRGTAISWSSDKPGYITTSGAVTRPASGTADEDVKLIATVTKGLASQTKQFTVRVKAMPATPPPSGSTGSGGSSAPVQSYKADVSGKDAAGTLPVSVNAGSNNAAVTAGPQQGDSITGGNPVVISMPSIPGVASFTLEIPADYLSASDGKGTLTLTTNTGSVTMPSNMLADTNGTKARITIGKGTPSGLPSDVKSAIGDRPLVQLTLTMDGKTTEWSNPDAPVTVSIPYKPTAAELANPEGIVIWYLDGSGNPVCVPGGRYDPASGSVTFMTTHFSYYAVSYKSASFHDVGAGAWYSKPIAFIAARDIASGTGNGKFSPNAKLTRGQFIVMLMNAYEITPDTNPGNNFSDAGNTYYTGYLASAKRLGISAGIGNNLFAPKKEITRQEMFALLYNGLKVIDKLPQGTTGKSISDFSDAAQVSTWAKDAMTLLLQTGTIGGSAGKLNPEATTTRAEMAQILYNLLSK